MNQQAQQAKTPASAELLVKVNGQFYTLEQAEAMQQAFQTGIAQYHEKLAVLKQVEVPPPA